VCWNKFRDICQCPLRNQWVLLANFVKLTNVLDEINGYVDQFCEIDECPCRNQWFIHKFWGLGLINSGNRAGGCTNIVIIVFIVFFSNHFMNMNPILLLVLLLLLVLTSTISITSAASVRAHRAGVIWGHLGAILWPYWGYFGLILGPSLVR
jgi:hypothetical protein